MGKPTQKASTKSHNPPNAHKAYGSKGSESDSPLIYLELLVDELIKDRPEEGRVKNHMLAAGLSYSKDPVERMNLVLETLQRARANKLKSRRSKGTLNEQDLS